MFFIALISLLSTADAHPRHHVVVPILPPPVLVVPAPVVHCDVVPPHDVSVDRWVPGEFNMRGVWIPGHWRLQSEFLPATVVCHM